MIGTDRRLRKPIDGVQESDATCSDAALIHGRLRYEQGYTPAMLVHESRILQMTFFGAFQNNRSSLDFSLLVLDVMKIAEEVDAQLTQTMTGYMEILSPQAA